MRTLVILILCISLTSCSIFKRSSKVKENIKTETIEKTTSDSTGTTIDKTKTVIKETIDTVVIVPEKKTSSEIKINIDSLINGITAIKNDLVIVKLDYDPITKLLTTKATILPQALKVKLNREITINKDVVQTSKIKEAVLREEKKQIKKVNKQKEPAKMGIWLVAVVVGLIIIVVSIFYWRKRSIPF